MIPLARYTNRVAHDVNRVVSEAITFSHEGGKLHLGSTVVVLFSNDKNFANSIGARCIPMWKMGYHIYLIKTSDSANVSQNQIMRVISLNKTIFKTGFLLHSKIIITMLQ